MVGLLKWVVDLAAQAAVSLHPSPHHVEDPTITAQHDTAPKSAPMNHYKCKKSSLALKGGGTVAGDCCAMNMWCITRPRPMCWVHDRGPTRRGVAPS